MKITKQFLERGGTKAEWGFAWTNKQVEILGETKSKGWVTRLIGKEITDEQAKQFLELNPNRYELFSKQPNDSNVELKKEWDALFNSILQNEGKVYLIDVMRDLWSMIDRIDK